MEPVLLDGFIVAVDTHPVDIKALDEEMVAARDPDGGVTIKWFRRTKAGDMLVAQHSSPDFNPILLSAEPGWAIIGKVLFWIGRPKKK
jgi:SOS-response transcriptional repressor LexA